MVLLRRVLLWKRSVLPGVTVTERSLFLQMKRNLVPAETPYLADAFFCQGWILTPSSLKAKLRGVCYICAGWLGKGGIAGWGRQGF